jgi:hypothetical protein
LGRCLPSGTDDVVPHWAKRPNQHSERAGIAAVFTDPDITLEFAKIWCTRNLLLMTSWYKLDVWKPWKRL